MFFRCLLASIILFYVVDAKQLEIDLNSEHVILINAKTGVVLFEKEADAKVFPASTTKIGTALYVLDCYGNRIDDVVDVKKGAVASITPQAKKESNYRSPPHWLETDGTKMGIKSGEELSVRSLLYGAMLVSGNDACNVLAMSCGGTIPKFMEELNHYLRTIGCHHTTFLNPHGLHHPGHVTTARDLATMARRGLALPAFREIVGTVRYVVPRSNLEEERTLVQTNLLMRRGSYFDPRVIGIKTGTTQAAGRCLVAAAREGERELISVVLGCRSRADALADTRKLFDVAFAQPLLRRTLVPAGESSLTRRVKGTRGKLKTYLPTPLCYDFYAAEEEAVKATITWDIPKLPIRQGQQVGMIAAVSEQGVVLQQVPLLAANDLKRSILLLIVLIPLSLLFVFFLAKVVRRR